jgi:hypothetical protein
MAGTRTIQILSVDARNLRLKVFFSLALVSLAVKRVPAMARLSCLVDLLLRGLLSKRSSRKRQLKSKVNPAATGSARVAQDIM